MIDVAVLALGTTVGDAINLPSSVIRKRFDGKEWEIWKKSKEAESKNVIGTIERLNQIVMALNNVCKTVNGSATAICKTINNQPRGF